MRAATLARLARLSVLLVGRAYVRLGEPRAALALLDAAAVDGLSGAGVDENYKIARAMCPVDRIVYSMVDMP